jgi:hypothetical protein
MLDFKTMLIPESMYVPIPRDTPFWWLCTVLAALGFLLLWAKWMTKPKTNITDVLWFSALTLLLIEPTLMHRDAPRAISIPLGVLTAILFLAASLSSLWDARP